MIGPAITPFWRTDRAVLLNADVLQGLRSLPPGSVHCCVGSPPYFGLRDYGLDPITWGGEPDCRHEWDDERTWRASPVRPEGARVGFHDAAATRRQRWSLGRNCRRCGGWSGSLGLEPLHDCLAWARGEYPCPRCYVCHVRTVFKELWRVLRPDGTVWWVVSDSYNGAGGSGFGNKMDGLKERQAGYPGRRLPGLGLKNLIGIPWRTALALQADGWTLRSDIVWAKPNCMPQSVTDRPTSSHEHVLLLSKGPRYFYDAEAIRQPAHPGANSASRAFRRGYGSRSAGDRDGSSLPGPSHSEPGAAGAAWTVRRNCRDVWTVRTAAYPGAHSATFPPALVESCILAGTSERGCCPRCGTPWRRKVVSGGAIQSWQRTRGMDAPANGSSDLKERILAGMIKRSTVGWRPGCSCGTSNAVPCTVLDPFAGSGTTGAVALSHGRSFVGIELSGSYCGLAVERLSKAEGIAAHAGGKPEAQPTEGSSRAHGQRRGATTS